jgi:hypothetical protein
VEVEVQGPLGIRSFSAGADRSRDWVDPFLGGRVLWRPSEKWLMGFRTDVGGFTVSSDFTFNVNAEVAYRINEWLFVNGGYRALYTDYETGSGNDRFEFDMWLHGPWVGVGIEL